MGGGPSGIDRINDSRKLGKRKSSRNGVYRESVMGIGGCGRGNGKDYLEGRTGRVLNAVLGCCSFVLGSPGCFWNRSMMSSSWKDLSGVSIRRERTQDHTLRLWIESCDNNPGERS